MEDLETLRKCTFSICNSSLFNCRAGLKTTSDRRRPYFTSVSHVRFAYFSYSAGLQGAENTISVVGIRMVMYIRKRCTVMKH